METELLAPALLGQRENAAQIISGQWRMIKVATVLISPFKTVLTQNLGEAIKEYGVIGANRVVSDREFQGHRDERKRDNARCAQIARGIHSQDSSSFGALVILEIG